MAGESFQQALDLLAPIMPGGVEKRAVERIQMHLSLVRQWNPVAGLVSNNDVSFLEERHVIDSLSLVPYVLRYCGPTGKLLDIGPGGGFPIIPILCVLPEIHARLVERSVRKVGFLQRSIALLQLEQAEVVHGNFPEVLPKIEANCITARAVDRPKHLNPSILKRMPQQCAFLCQSDTFPISSRKMFHVEHVNDLWRQAALRRGELYIITHQKQR